MVSSTTRKLSLGTAIASLGLIAVSLVVFPADAQVPRASGTEVFAVDIVEYRVGEPHAAVVTETFHGVGDPDGNGLSFGCGGTAVYRFGNAVLVDVAGPDIKLHGLGFGDEAVLVELSGDGQSWVSAGIVAEGAAIDIAAHARASAPFRFVRVTDRTEGCGGGQWPGAEIDTVSARVSAAPPRPLARQTLVVGCRGFNGIWELGDGAILEMTQGASGLADGFHRFDGGYGTLSGTVTGDRFLGSYSRHSRTTTNAEGSMTLRLASDGRTFAGSFELQSSRGPSEGSLRGTCLTRVPSSPFPVREELNPPPSAIYNPSAAFARIERLKGSGDCLTAEDEVMIMLIQLHAALDRNIEDQAKALNQLAGIDDKSSEEILVERSRLEYYVDWANDVRNIPCVLPP